MASLPVETEDALIAANNPDNAQLDDMSDDAGAAQDDVASGPAPRRQYPGEHHAVRPHEHPPAPAPRRPVLRLPEPPKSLNGQRLTRPTLGRDRDMLESKKQRG